MFSCPPELPKERDGSTLPGEAYGAEYFLEKVLNTVFVCSKANKNGNGGYIVDTGLP